MHCENGRLIDALTADAAGAGRRGARVFAETRPPEVEEEAVSRALAAAALTGAACYLVHLSCAQALDQVRLARARGRPKVIAEACPHHLLLDDRSYAGAGAGRYLVAPPLRPAAHLRALWEALADGTIDTVGSDHCQVRSPVPGGIAPAGQSYAYGLAGIGARLPLLLSEGLARGVPIGRLVQVAAENPARAFGHYPAKGALVPGADADITVFDPAGQTVLGADGFGDGTGDSVYAGRRLGRPHPDRPARRAQDRVGRRAHRAAQWPVSASGPAPLSDRRRPIHCPAINRPIRWIRPVTRHMVANRLRYPEQRLSAAAG